jgi:hypothetical protein
MDNTKLCRRCGERKPLEQFYPSRKIKDGRLSWCRPCTNTYACEAYARRLAKQPPKWVVYTFNDPDGFVFYVGSGRPHRPLVHFRNYRGGGSALIRKFEEIMQADGKPSFEIVSEHDSVEAARAAEGELIRRLVVSGRLVNQVLCPAPGNLSRLLQQPAG